MTVELFKNILGVIIAGVMILAGSLGVMIYDIHFNAETSKYLCNKKTCGDAAY